MQKAHCRGLVFGRTIFDERTEQNFRYAATHRIYEHCSKKTVKCVAYGNRQNSEQHKSRAYEQMSRNGTRAVSDFLNEFCGKQVDRKLHCEVYDNKQCHLRKRNSELRLKSQEQKRCEVVDDGLTNISRKTSRQSGFVIFENVFHYSLPKFINKIAFFCAYNNKIRQKSKIR